MSQSWDVSNSPHFFKQRWMLTWSMGYLASKGGIYTTIKNWDLTWNRYQETLWRLNGHFGSLTHLQLRYHTQGWFSCDAVFLEEPTFWGLGRCHLAQTWKIFFSPKMGSQTWPTGEMVGSRILGNKCMAISEGKLGLKPQDLLGSCNCRYVAQTRGSKGQRTHELVVLRVSKCI